jgi:hypothetical protein
MFLSHSSDRFVSRIFVIFKVFFMFFFAYLRPNVFGSNVNVGRAAN